tara:strand:- start:202 stop:597 length:396 start_codon:yes stop_codon:yes gene_type:complete
MCVSHAIATVPDNEPSTATAGIDDSDSCGSSGREGNKRKCVQTPGCFRCTPCSFLEALCVENTLQTSTSIATQVTLACDVVKPEAVAHWADSEGHVILDGLRVLIDFHVVCGEQSGTFISLVNVQAPDSQA